MSKLVKFFLANAFGFFSVSICYVLATTGNILDVNASDFNINFFQEWFLAGTMLTWLVCAVFSTAYFFTNGKMSLLFLFAPIVFPIAYGLSVILLYVSA